MRTGRSHAFFCVPADMRVGLPASQHACPLTPARPLLPSFCCLLQEKAQNAGDAVQDKYEEVKVGAGGVVG